MKQGDRIEMVLMGDDPLPIEPGTQGTVTDVQKMTYRGQQVLDVQVDWDNGRTLGLVIPPDVVNIL